MIKKFKDIILNKYLIVFGIYYFTLFLDATSLEIDYPCIEVISKIIRYIIYMIFFARLIFLIPSYKKDIMEKNWKQKTVLIKIVYILVKRDIL